MSLVFPSCDTCQGSGWANPGYPAAGSCDDCDGRGWVMNEKAVEAVHQGVFRKADELRWEGEEQLMGELIEIVDVAIAEFLRVIEEGPE